MNADELCSYSMDGRHHFGSRLWGNRIEGGTREVFACRCGLVGTDDEKKAVGELEKVTSREQSRQRNLSRSMLRKIAGTGEQPRLPL